MTTDTLPYVEMASQENDFQAWQAEHLTGIGASEIASVLGQHPFKSRLRLYAEKRGTLPPQDLSDNEAVEMGLLLEPIVADLYKRRTQRGGLEKGGVLLRSVEYPWALATVDYWLYGREVPLQIKTTSQYMLSHWVDGPPRAVFLQVQQEMLVTGAREASVGVLVGGQRFYWADVPRDEETIALIIEAGSRFWEQVQEGEWPDLDGTADTADAIAELWPVSTGEEMMLPPEAVEVDNWLALWKDQRKLSEENIEAYSNQLKVWLGAAERGLLPDGSGYSYKTQERQEHTVKASTFRVLRKVKARE